MEIASAAVRGCGARMPAAVTVFVCANCARPPQAPPSAGRKRPVTPNFAWPIPVQEVLVPCTGRIQPEHVLKAFESGSDAVCAIACESANCHYVEGSGRCARRMEYVRSILDEIGIDSARLMLFTLPGTAAEDLALAMGKPSPEHNNGVVERIAAIRDSVLRTLESLPPNPLRKPALVSNQELDVSYDDTEQ
jgi:coenzyme F420-reducing hydrogenase delta subunit